MTTIRSADELSAGMAFDLGGFVLTREEVLDFARRFDPQPFHLEEEAARDSLFGRLVASGLHTFSAAVGHLIRSGIFAQVNLGAGGAQLAWPAPLDPDTPVTMRVIVEEVRPSRSKPDMAIVKLRYVVARQADDVVVLEVQAPHFMRR
ncbi:MaoC/PaaZ C-terminal domain-containing protein [Falsiroseomonas oryzae]|uniref:MaoC/PaaZ C-terminal domain-containing protein n=1 Tax=Falsiroseomonas oryzae TaxID=2766473 RepID=UPI0022EB70B7|nr:MaoC/PaaZ C-terminal domain-containing protein [Roseomonas sp. MO-31]